MKLVMLGDSTMAGAYAAGTYPNPVEGCRPASTVPWFAASLQSSDLPVFDAAQCGDNNVSNFFKQDGTTVATLADYDTGRTGTLNAGWTSLAAGNVLTLGANALSATGTNSFNYRPFEPCDTLEVWYRQDVGLSTSWSITKTGSAESLTGLSSAGTAALVKATLRVATPTINFWNIQRAGGGGAVVICMLDAYDSTRPAVRVYNAGWPSSRCSDLKSQTAPWSNLSALIALNPDLVVMQPGINEYNNAGDQTGSPSATVGGQFPATYQADLESIVQKLLAAGINIILRTHYPSQNSIRNLTMQKAYRDVTVAVAAKYGLVCDDVWTKISTWEQANNRAWMSDSLHPVGTLYQKSGESAAALVQAVMTA